MEEKPNRIQKKGAPEEQAHKHPIVEPRPRDMEKFAREYEARNNQDTKAAKRKWWIKTALMLVLIGASIGVMFGIARLFDGNGFGPITFNWIWLAVVIGVLLVTIVNESMKYAYLLKISTGKWRFKNSVKVMFLGKYYDGITPLGTGGQPFQIYYLHKKDIPAGVASAVPLVRYIVCTIVFCLVAAALFITANFVLEGNAAASTTVMIVAWISMLCNLAIPVIIVFASLFPRAGKKFVVKLVSLLAKMRIVKRKYAVTKKYVREMDEYRHALKTLLSNFVKLLPMVLFSLIECACYVLLPFSIVIAVSGVAPGWDILLEMACLSMISFYSSSLVPTPGNTIANEAMTILVFTAVAGNPAFAPVSGWVTLFWRFLTYYIYILSGIGINVFEVIRSAIRAHRTLKTQSETPMSADSPLETLPPPQNSDQENQ